MSSWMGLFRGADIEELKRRRDWNRLVRLLQPGQAQERRVAAARALGELRKARAVDALVPLVREEDRDVSVAVIQALGQIGDRRAKDALLRAVRIRSSRHEALKALALLTDPEEWERCAREVREGEVREYLCDLDHPLGAVRVQAVERLIELGQAAVEPLMALLKERAIRGEAKRLAREVLVRLAKEVPAERFLALLQDPTTDPELKTMAAEALSQSANSCALEPLLEAVEAGLWWNDMAKGLAKLKPSPEACARAVDAIIRQANRPHSPRSGPDGEAYAGPRLQAAQILGRWGDRRAVDALCEWLLHDSDGQVRAEAAKALGELGDARAVPALTLALQDTYGYHAGSMGFRYSVREAAGAALERIVPVLAKNPIRLGFVPNRLV